MHRLYARPSQQNYSIKSDFLSGNPFLNCIVVAFLTMCALFRNKYHIGSIRYRGHDYSGPGRYSVTICTKNKNHYFGEIQNGKMFLSGNGKIVQQLLIELSTHFPFVELDEYIIMPDHVHVIIIINESQKNQNIIGQNDDVIVSSPIDNGYDMVEPLHATVPQQPSTNIIDGDKKPFTNNPPGDENPYTNSPGETKNMHMSSISPSTGSLATIIRSFKSAITKTMHKTNHDFEWQPRFYDHIIRTGIELSRIRNYIKSNPEKWNNQR